MENHGSDQVTHTAAARIALEDVIDATTRGIGEQQAAVRGVEIDAVGDGL